MITIDRPSLRLPWDRRGWSVLAPERDDLYFRLKRLMDFVLALGLLVLLAPVLLLIGLLIKLDSPGSPLFTQERMGFDWRGRKRRPFVIFKFRSMYQDCDQGAHKNYVRRWIRGELGAEEDAGKLANDRRVTRIGRILRKTSLDELPQLWNVLKGDMSLVGPRPVPLYEVAEYQAWHLRRLQATPGLTGLWQVNGRGRGTVDEMARLDIEYIDRQTVWYDLRILLLTIPAMLSGRGAA